MKLTTLYLILCFFGTILPLLQFIPWLIQNGLNVPLFFQNLFANEVAAFFGLDVIVSAFVLLTFIYSEGKKIKLNNLWVPVLATLSIGVSLGLPLFLYMRQRKIQ